MYRYLIQLILRLFPTPVRVPVTRGLRCSARNRGSAIILVAAVLVMLMLIGAAYVTSARSDHIASKQINRGDIHAVTEAELQRIVTLIGEDLMDPATGDMLDGTATGGSREPFDYPHANVDPWLAATAPEDVGGSYEWRHISDVTDAGLVGFTPAPAPTTADLTGSDVADADGDGITDSRFVDAAVSSMRGVRYVAAVRVVDLSSMINVNTALSQVNGSMAYNATTNAPRWWYPSELDFGLFAQDLSGLAITDAELQNLLGYHLGDANAGSETSPDYGASLPTPWSTRYLYWRDAARRHGSFESPYRPLTVADELELRHRGGLNSPDSRGSMIGVLAPDFLREPATGATREGSYASVAADITTFFDNEPRHQMTVLSGAAELAGLVGSETGTQMAVDVNAASGDAIAAAAYSIYSLGTPAWNGASDVDSAHEFAAQFAANVLDYGDVDNRISQATSGSVTRYGWEPLPMIAEAFVQYDYQVAYPPAGSGSNWTVTWNKGGNGFVIELRNPYHFAIPLDDVWIKIGADVAQRLTSLTDTFTGSTFEGAVLGAGEYLVVYKNTGSSAGNNDLLAAQGLNDGTDDPVYAAVSASAAFDTNTGPGTVTVQLYAADTSGARLSFPYQSLPVRHPGNAASYSARPYSDATNLTAGNQNSMPWAYKHQSTIGQGKKLHIIGTQAGDFTTDQKNYTVEEDPQSYNAGMDHLGDEDKTPRGASDITGLDPTQQQLLFAQRTDGTDGTPPGIVHVGELAQVAVIGAQPGLTIDQAWGGAGDVASFMLSFDPADGTVATTAGDNLQLPHGTVLLSRLTTLNPTDHTIGGLNVEVEEIDNDGDGQINEPDERMVMGRINLNTAPASLLKRVLPLLDDADNSVGVDLVDHIVAYRAAENDADRVDGVRGSDASGYTPGIATVSELMNLPAFRGHLTTAPYGGDTQALLASNIRIDWLNGEDTAGNMLASDNVEDDREEQAFVMKWLSQVATTRSDVFAAYVLVRGYRGDTLSAENVVSEKRVLAIIDRSKMTAAGDRPRVIAVMEY